MFAVRDLPTQFWFAVAATIAVVVVVYILFVAALSIGDCGSAVPTTKNRFLDD